MEYLAPLAIKRVLLSLSDKNLLQEFVTSLQIHGAEFVGTGTTCQALRDLGVPCTPVEELTQFPEMLGGRVKTLHPAIFGGILARSHLPSDLAQLSKHNLVKFDMVVCNLYPFQQKAQTQAPLADLIETVDIGGVSLLRAAAKNHDSVAVVCDTRDYNWIIEELQQNQGTLSGDTRKRLALKALTETAAYDTAISAGLAAKMAVEPLPNGPIAAYNEKEFPEVLNLRYRKMRDLRYGENPHQLAALYESVPVPNGLAISRMVCEHGKEPSYNNLLDIEHAVGLCWEFKSPAVVIVKHNVPCCVAVSDTLSQPEMYLHAIAADPISPFGGVICFNREVVGDTVKAFGDLFLEVVVAPSYTVQARELLEKRKNLRIVTWDVNAPSENNMQYTHVQGGLLLQNKDSIAATEYRCVTKGAPLAGLQTDIFLAERIVKHAKSNAIVLVKEGRALAIAGGFTNRVDAVAACLHKVNQPLNGAVLGSDAFFPFADSIELLKGKDLGAIVQPGGSLRDKEVIAKADELGIAMLFTGVRHFKH